MTAALVLPDSEPVTYVGRREWLAARSTGIGGSDVSAILGMSRWSSPLDVWREKTGRAQPQRRTWAMARGTALEPLLLEWLTDNAGIAVHKVPMQRSVSRPWMLGSLDGVGSDLSVVEAKTTSWWLRDEWEGEQVADHAELQSQWYMAVTGLASAWVIAAISDDDPVIRPVTRDDALIEQMVAACERFWVDNVLGDREPTATAIDLPALTARPADPGTVYLGGDNTDEQLRLYQKLGTKIREFQQMRDDVKAELLQEIGDAGIVVVGGEVAATRKTFDKPGYVVEPRTETRFTVPAKRKAWKPDGH